MKNGLKNVRLNYRMREILGNSNSDIECSSKINIRNKILKFKLCRSKASRQNKSLMRTQSRKLINIL